MLIWAVLYFAKIQAATNKARQKIILRHGCKPPAKQLLRDPFFGVDAIVDALRVVIILNVLGSKT